MSLPVPNDYLALALQTECRVKDITLAHQQVGELLLPTGQLVACDPVVFPEMEPFTLPLPRGRFPVILSIAQIATSGSLSLLLGLATAHLLRGTC